MSLMLKDQLLLYLVSYSLSRIMMIMMMIGKKQRLTLIECSNDLGCMMDLAKVADLVSYCVIVCALLCIRDGQC